MRDAGRFRSLKPSLEEPPMSQEAVPVDPHDMLYVPMRRRFMSEYVTNSEGNRELHPPFGFKEIVVR